jgi:hypothetical protein
MRAVPEEEPAMANSLDAPISATDGFEEFHSKVAGTALLSSSTASASSRTRSPWVIF